jgi:hypothetical protein
MMMMMCCDLFLIDIYIYIYILGDDIDVYL